MNRRRVREVVTASLMVASLAPRAQAQSDPRWQSWLGCWTAVQADSTTPMPTVCVIPAAGTSAVDIVEIADLRVVSRNHFDADGSRQPSERNGCTGWDRAAWSPEGRVLLHSEHDCAEGGRHVTTAVMAMQAEGQWLTVMGASASGRRVVQVQHFRPAPDDIALPEEVALALGDSVRARQAVDATNEHPVGSGEIIAVNRQVELYLLEAWLAMDAGPVRFNGRQLAQLSDSGVQESTIDLLVGLANPALFAIAATPPAPERLGVPGAPGAVSAPVMPGGVYIPVGQSYGSGPFVDSDSALRCYNFNRYWQTSMLGYSYMVGTCGTYATSWFYQRPQIQVQVVSGSATKGNGPPPKGRAIAGQGYTQGASRPTTETAPSNRGASDAYGNRQDGAAASPSGYSPGSNTSTSTGRTAVPRP